MHRLGDYKRANAIRTVSEDKEHVRIEVPRGKYSAIRYLVAGNHFNSEMPVVLEFADGTKQHGLILCDEWSLYELRPGVVPALSNLDWIRKNKFEDVNRVCIFEVILTVNPTLDLVAFVLETEKATYTESRTRFNLYAATGILADP